jgi:hypothetical protein
MGVSKGAGGDRLIGEPIGSATGEMTTTVSILAWDELTADPFFKCSLFV